MTECVGWLLFGFSIVFGLGVTVWSLVLPHMRLPTAMRITLGAMLPVCAGIYLLNHSGGQSVLERWGIGVITPLLIMVESGFTPPALPCLAGTLPVQSVLDASIDIYTL